WDKRNFEVFFQKGEIYISMWSLTREDNFLKEGILNYEKAISLNPYLIKSYRRLAYIYETIGNYKEAEKYYVEVLKRYPNKKLYNLEMARYYKKIGENEKFKFYFEKSKHLQSVTKEEKIMVEEIEKWIELQK
ncbi:MAG: tetratricopeptide repeat protein, partial [bacterium]|nr:tetratricopeptide repeat protein [bacterium]MDW8164843.1 tetratricopeptide repeat protein [Candidatus Omnitrophota bacterium]